MSSFNPITKARFFEIAATYGLNRQAASDIWFCQPIDHFNDSEDVIIGNFELIATPAWAKNMNESATKLERHLYQSGVAGAGRFCRECGRKKQTPTHNLDIDTPAAAIVTVERRRLN
jgi:hypothetical protein